MFKRSSSTQRGDSAERTLMSNDSTQRPVAVTTVKFDNGTKLASQLTSPPPPTTPRLHRSVNTI